jgi:hypothetical protein
VEPISPVAGADVTPQVSWSIGQRRPGEFWKGKRLMDWTKLSSIAAAALAVVLIAVPATIVAPVAVANVAGCLPLNGTQLTASSHEDTNYLGIIYDSNVTYWYQDGAVNWHRTVDGGSWNLTHTNTSGTVPAAPGSTATIPGTDSGRRGENAGSPIIVTVCNQ